MCLHEIDEMCLLRSLIIGWSMQKLYDFSRVRFKGGSFLLIREAVSDDLPAMLDIYNDAIENSTATFDIEKKSLDERKEWFAKYGGRYPLLVAKTEGAVVGYGSLSRYKDRAAYDLTVELSIYISPDHQGQGIGKQLMEKLIERSIESGFHTIISGVTGGNEVSIKLHEKFGFQHVGHLSEMGWKFDQWLDVHFYQLILER